MCRNTDSTFSAVRIPRLFATRFKTLIDSPISPGGIPSRPFSLPISAATAVRSFIRERIRSSISSVFRSNPSSSIFACLEKTKRPRNFFSFAAPVLGIIKGSLSHSTPRPFRGLRVIVIAECGCRNGVHNNSHDRRRCFMRLKAARIGCQEYSHSLSAPIGEHVREQAIGSGHSRRQLPEQRVAAENELPSPEVCHDKAASVFSLAGIV